MTIKILHVKYKGETIDLGECDTDEMSAIDVHSITKCKMREKGNFPRFPAFYYYKPGQDGDYVARPEEECYESDTSLEAEQIQGEIVDYYVCGDDKDYNALNPNEKMYDGQMWEPDPNGKISIRQWRRHGGYGEPSLEEGRGKELREASMGLDDEAAFLFLKF
ncbi:hypothetical protein Cgig2_006848 [Carnegiea gigantea]|uniref:Uncharacterized protein n=1 Tax=Carnegiea gigantea TaxID=171969 RepID=A0A9Q1JVN3_9CARY|nr:hypothetical protein Cgig2_006848 [Carnegiea gigantea]